jgi:hypothetical protein
MLERLMKIGVGPAYDTQCDIEHHLWELEVQTHLHILEKIGTFNPQNEGNFNHGYDGLVAWYHSQR